MRIYQIDPDDATSKLSLAYAMRQGYKFTLESDGCAEITKKDGTVYHIHDWRCDCPDATGRDGGSYTKGDTDERACKHVFWVSQVRPCDSCGGIQTLHDTGGWAVFTCHACRSLRPAMGVRDARRKAIEQAQATRAQIDALTAECEGLAARERYELDADLV